MRGSGAWVRGRVVASPLTPPSPPPRSVADRTSRCGGGGEGAVCGVALGSDSIVAAEVRLTRYDRVHVTREPAFWCYMVPDLSQHSHPFTKFLSGTEHKNYRLTDEQVAFYHENGYLAGVRILDDAQIEQLRTELAPLFDPKHPGNHLFHEYHTNESPDPSR